MNRVERAKAKALGCCRFVPGSAAKRFAREMRWLALNEPATVLSPSQRWYLDKMVWHYRRQLAGTDIEIPASEPKREDYLAAAEARSAKRRRDLNGGIDPPKQQALI